MFFLGHVERYMGFIAIATVNIYIMVWILKEMVFYVISPLKWMIYKGSG